MKKALKIIGLLIIFLLIAAGITAALIPRQQLINYVAPEVRYVTVTNAIITETKADLEVQLEVTSKLIPVFVDSLVYDFRLFDESLARGNQKFKPDSKSGKVQNLIIPVSVDQERARQLIRRQVSEGQKIKAHIEAYCRFPVVGLRRVNIDREVDMTIPLPGTEIVPVSLRGY